MANTVKDLSVTDVCLKIAELYFPSGVTRSNLAQAIESTSIRFAQVARKQERLICEIERSNEYANAERVVGWIKDPNRKPALQYFTEGPEREIGYAIEEFLTQKKGENNAR